GCKSPWAGSSLIVWGSFLIPTPSSRIWWDCSKPSHGMPRACSISAVVSPPIPPPAMITFMDRLPDNRRLRSNVRDQNIRLLGRQAPVSEIYHRVLFGLDIGLADHVAPALRLFLDEGPRLSRGAAA